MTMSRLWTTIALAAVLSACVQLAPTPQDLQAKRFESAPGKAVIYLVRAVQDLGDVPATVWLDNQVMGATYMGSYFRWEVPAGRHLIAGYASDPGRIVLDVQADRTYFVQQMVMGGGRAPSPHSFFHVVDERTGRAHVMQGTLVGVARL
jgi:hypothetical protein